MQSRAFIRHHRTARGVAPLEIALALPVLALLMAFFFVIANSIVTRSQAAINARNESTQGRFPDKANSRSSESGSRSVPIGGEIRRITANGVNGYRHSEATSSIGEDTQIVHPVFEVFSHMAVPGTVRHEFMASPLDFRSVPFPEHDRLTLTEYATRFGINENQLDDLAALGAIRGAAGLGRNPLRTARNAATQASNAFDSNTNRAAEQLQQLFAYRELLRNPPITEELAKEIGKYLRQIGFSRLGGSLANQVDTAIERIEEFQKSLDYFQNAS